MRDSVYESFALSRTTPPCSLRSIPPYRVPRFSILKTAGPLGRTAAQSFKTLVPRPAAQPRSNYALALVAALKRSRTDLKKWRRRAIPLNTREKNCKTVISVPELNLCRVIIKVLQRTLQEKALYWIQRGKVRTTMEGDENSRYFHASASARLRKNTINVLVSSGTEFYSYGDKSTILSDYYASLLGTTFQSTWPFSLHDLYPNPAPHLTSLDAPFTDEEISTAFLSMNQNASPGPDGFGPGFYRNFWHILKGKIMDFFLDFHAQRSDISCLNRAHIILLPKHRDARSPADFWPISLQNCPINGWQNC